MVDSSGDRPLVDMTDILKTYSSNGVTACDHASLVVQPDTIHMVVGENGAGKSTLMKILSGDLQADAGSIRYRGKEVFWRHPDQALDEGVGMIHQILHIFPGLSVREHLLLDMKRLPLLGRLEKSRIDEQIDHICRTYEINCSPDEPIEQLDAEGRQSAALMALISRDVDLFILDEPPRSLLSAAQKLRKKGKTIIVITHNMDDALAYGDAITVMKKGKSMGTYRSQELTREELTGLIMGEAGGQVFSGGKRGKRGQSPHEIIRIDKLTGGRPGTVDWVRDISLCVHAGETVAVVGIRDNGLRALETLCAGYTEFGYILESGEIKIAGRHPRSCPPEILGYVPSDRLETGSSVSMSVQDNLIIHSRRNPELLNRWSGLYSSRKLKVLTDRAISEFSIKGESHYPLITLSGGNIQKLITARALMPRPRVLICADISWGLDIRTRSMLFDKINAYKAEGMGVLMFTSEAEAALEESDRIAILKRGSLSGILENKPGITPSDIGAMML
jgi:simple sugar transport system ATP-binding protein